MSTAQFMTRVFKKWIELHTGAIDSIVFGYPKVHPQFHWPFPPERSVDSWVLFFPTNNFLDGLIEFCEHSWHDNIKIESTSKAWLRPFRIKSIKVWAKTVFSNFLKIFKNHQKSRISYIKCSFCQMILGKSMFAIGYTAYYKSSVPERDGRPCLWY